jgi:hypothetical protein
VAAFLPTFGALTGSFLGGQIGADALREGSLKAALSKISIAEILAQSAGSTIGMFAGAHLFTSLAAGLGSFAGPLGSIVGGIVGAQLGMWAVRTVKSMITGGDDDPENVDIAGSQLKPSQSLPGAAILPAASLRQIQDDYRASYVRFIQAEQSGNKQAREQEHAKLNAMKQQYELAVRSMVSGMAEAGHKPAPANAR